MSNEERRKQMVTEAKAYKAKFYDDEPADSKIKTKPEETFTDFCAGWIAADKSRWIPVEKELPKEKQKVLAYFSPNEKCDHEYACEALYNYGFHHWEDAEDPGVILEGVTHWMEIQPPRKED